ncbi:SKI [Cordylochernes scorpioides]|uniref:SKI n=1 Tax=Cordylochernes scorpioides TaxID=51811 RepID=A0ABY6KNJ3_9ARAC|nr:SKI [Cordylochernes scorpioides]
MSGSKMYTPHLKKVLRSYQAAATSSLQGPNSFIWSDDASKVSSSSKEDEEPVKVVSKTTADTPTLVEFDPFLAPPPFPIQQPPIFTPADRANCERSETLLEDFLLQMYVEQLEVLKTFGDLPLNAPSCGLITKSDAERLSAALLETREPKTVLPKTEEGKSPFGFKVFHYCFGKTSGIYYPDYYSNPFAPCIECLQCKGMFSPKKFICHVHNPKQNKTCHWGFDSDNWRNYLILDTEDAEYEANQEELLTDLKKKFDYPPPVKRKLDRQRLDWLTAVPLISLGGDGSARCTPMSGSKMYTPHLKKVLRSYQAAATSSLQGPNSFIWSDDASKVSSSSKEDEEPVKVVSKTTADTPTLVEFDPFLAPPPFPIQQPPIFTPADRANCERSETLLEGETIACFTVGGEKRLCFPQILNTVLKDFSLQQINNVCDDMQIFCSRCTVEQLEVLKTFGDLPLNAPSCGLITKSDAERLSAALLETREPKTVLPKTEEGKSPFGFKVFHYCFGKTSGIYYPDYYSNPFAPCIECLQCKGMFSPKKFICHVHNPKQNKTCHWGFDSDNWRNYLILDTEDAEYEANQEELLTDLKKKFDYPPPVKRKVSFPVDGLLHVFDIHVETHLYSIQHNHIYTMVN